MAYWRNITLFIGVNPALIQYSVVCMYILIGLVMAYNLSGNI
jgi:hypothetical protein